MRRLRLASLFALVLALTGGFAAPTRPARSTQLVASIGWFQATPDKPPSRPHTPPVRYSGRVRVTNAFPMPQAPAFSPARLTHALFQRPPPDNS
ncbi:MAG TPA: hypothetical protein VES67_04615 [Vicinamibacterales bacterium]|nr:hypothetical protein [Vicinamibacterales bacterium]